MSRTSYGSIPPVYYEFHKEISSAKTSFRVLVVALLTSAVLVTLVALSGNPSQAMLLETFFISTPVQSDSQLLVSSNHFDTSASFDTPTNEDGLSLNSEVNAQSYSHA
mmetsp:Transcript_57278/g.119762  ORF Transcript_57278/g.119762 Transcript_57278/m.119762 type:complete len:108 (-) Transcript_57278:2-325(-)